MTSRKRVSRVELTQHALGDLQAIEQFSIAEWGRKVAHRYLDDLAAALDRLSENPEILRLEPEFAPGLCFYRVRKHILGCDYSDELVIVLTVIHSSMDLPARLLELEPRLAEESRILRAKLRGPA